MIRIINEKNLNEFTNNGYQKDGIFLTKKFDSFSSRVLLFVKAFLKTIGSFGAIYISKDSRETILDEWHALKSKKITVKLDEIGLKTDSVKRRTWQSETHRKLPTSAESFKVAEAQKIHAFYALSFINPTRTAKGQMKSPCEANLRELNTMQLDPIDVLCWRNTYNLSLNPKDDLFKQMEEDLPGRGLSYIASENSCTIRLPSYSTLNLVIYRDRFVLLANTSKGVKSLTISKESGVKYPGIEIDSQIVEAIKNNITLLKINKMGKSINIVWPKLENLTQS